MKQDQQFDRDTCLGNADFSVVHEVQNVLELLEVDALQVEEWILVIVLAQDPAKERRTSGL